VFPARSEDVPHDGRRREPLARHPTVEFIRYSGVIVDVARCFAECISISLLIEE
jgi:hypothetical protein